jgi:RNA polymerase sigma factor (sigma-70 family)
MDSTDPSATADRSPSSWTTADLVHAACGRERGAWEELMRRYQALVCAVVRSHRLQEADVGDAVQNTWLRAVERLDTVRDADRLGGWLSTVARRECLALLARSRRETPTEADGMVHELPEPGPEALVLADDTDRAVARAMAELPAGRRELVRVLFADVPPTYVDAARQTGLPIGSIGPTRQRTLRTLRSGLARAGYDTCAVA